MISYSITSAIIGGTIGLSILYLIRQDRLRAPYAVWWMIVALAVILLGLFPQLVDLIASRLGVHYPPILVVIVALGLLLLKILTMDIERTKQEQQLRRLTQRIALLEAKLKELESENKV